VVRTLGVACVLKRFVSPRWNSAVVSRSGRYAQPTCFIAHPEFQIFCMCLILPASNSIT
jgi:hypothetical protein